MSGCQGNLLTAPLHGAILVLLSPVATGANGESGMEYKDYYKTLGVESRTERNQESLPAAAAPVHPDMNPSDKAAEARFKEINEAHEVLSDAEKTSQV